MIYFMQPAGGGPVWIGNCVIAVEQRRQCLDRYYRCELVLLATTEGGSRGDRGGPGRRA